MFFTLFVYTYQIFLQKDFSFHNVNKTEPETGQLSLFSNLITGS